MKNGKTYDVVILGGGLAGLTLALQLKLANAKVAVLVLEKEKGDAPASIHKVGESLVELGSYYLREMLQLGAYLEEYQLRKLGFRYFFSQGGNEEMASRVEIGSRIDSPLPAYQVDRGMLENELRKRAVKSGVQVIFGAKVIGVDISKPRHHVYYEQGEQEYTQFGRWIIDSTGRRSFLKRKFNLVKAVKHKMNAVWFRLAREIDIHKWSKDEEWRNYIPSGYRRLATNHLMGKGYWVWIISLASGGTSVGLIADPTFHSFDEFNTFEKVMEWMEKHEPLAFKMLVEHKKNLLDFKVMKHLAHNTKQFYSRDRWGLTGDAAMFLDPFYSSGIDFIGLNNTWLTSLIIKDICGGEIAFDVMNFEHLQRGLIKGWALLYDNMYALFGKPQIMSMKIVWDWGAYWAIPTLMFINKGYTNAVVLNSYSATSNSFGVRFSRLNREMQGLFLAWGNLDKEEPASNQRINVFDLECLVRFYRGLKEPCTSEDLLSRIEENLRTLEQIAAEMFRVVCAKIHGTSLDMKVNPYDLNIKVSKEELLEKSQGMGALEVDVFIREDIAKLCLHTTKNVSSYVE